MFGFLKYIPPNFLLVILIQLLLSYSYFLINISLVLPTHFATIIHHIYLALGLSSKTIFQRSVFLLIVFSVRMNVSRAFSFKAPPLPLLARRLKFQIDLFKNPLAPRQLTLQLYVNQRRMPFKMCLPEIHSVKSVSSLRKLT